MAKLIFVPDWLNAALTDRGEHVSTMSSKVLDASILSKYDIINYYKAQLEFVKYMCNDKFSSMEELSEAYTKLMWHELPPLEELTIYMNEHFASEVDFSQLVCENQNISDTKYVIRGSDDNKIAYIIGGSVKSNALNALPSMRVNANRVDVMHAVLDKSYNGFRVITDMSDRSSVFRENYFLTQLYVKSLCCM